MNLIKPLPVTSLDRNPEYSLLCADVQRPSLVQQFHLSHVGPGARREGLQHLNQAGFTATGVEGQFSKI